MSTASTKATSKCPKCGCAPRRVIARQALVHLDVGPDGALGKILRAYGATDFSTATYECSGGHRWPFPVIPHA